MTAIFISHSSLDNRFASEMKDWLAGRGYERVFLDIDGAAGIPAGDNWEARLYREIERCHAVVLLLTTNWLESKWCFVEFAQARALGKVIFPVILSPMGEVSIAPEIQRIDLRDWNADGQDYLDRRIREVTGEIARGFAWDPNRPPYPGIHSFEAADAAVFFGRDPEIREIVEILEARRVQGAGRMILLAGGSGCGKSSLLKAGILPKLARDRRLWIVLPPLRPGRDPVTALAKALAEAAGSAETWRDLRDRLGSLDGPRFLLEALDDLRIGEARNATVVIAIDQLEEAFTLADGDEREALLRLLQPLLDGRRSMVPALVVATMRSDFLGEAAGIDATGLALETIAVGPMPLERLPAVIEGPASVAAIALQRGLAERIASDLDAAEAIPLLAFALRELYERHGRSGRIDEIHYLSLGDPSRGIGPIANAIRRKADDVMVAAKPDERERAALRSTFVPHLVAVREDGALVRRPALLDRLPVAGRRLVEAFVEARLLSLRLDPASDGRRVVEVSHEALFAAWPLLSAWIEEERDLLTEIRRLDAAVREWREAPVRHRRASLLRGLPLARARRIAKHRPDALSPAEAAFVAASRRAELRRRLGTAAAGVACLASVGTYAGSRLYVEYAKATALGCDVLAAESDNDIGLPGVEFDLIDWRAAIPACEAAVGAQPDNPRLVHGLARSLDVAGRKDEAAELYGRAAAMGWSWSQNNLGVLRLHGQGVPMDFAGGVSLLREAADRGNPQALANYAEADFAPFVSASPSRLHRVEEALRRLGFLNTSGPADGEAVASALARFKTSAGLTEASTTLRVLDRLGVVETISADIAGASRRAAGIGEGDGG